MKRVKIAMFVLAAFAVLAIVLGVLFLPQFLAERSAVPFQYMWVWFEDDAGIATIRSEAFQVAFEGQSFGSRWWSGNYPVDGRYGFRLFSRPESAAGEAGDGVSCHYSQKRRLLIFQYKGHEIAYSHALKKLTVDGREYSTAEGQVRLLVKRNGRVERVEK